MFYVQRLGVQNYRCFKEFSASFEPGLNAVTGGVTVPAKRRF